DSLERGRPGLPERDVGAVDVAELGDDRCRIDAGRIDDVDFHRKEAADEVADTGAGDGDGRPSAVEGAAVTETEVALGARHVVAAAAAAPRREVVPDAG